MVGTPGRKDWGVQPTGSQNPSCAASHKPPREGALVLGLSVLFDLQGELLGQQKQNSPNTHRSGDKNLKKKKKKSKAWSAGSKLGLGGWPHAALFNAGPLRPWERLAQLLPTGQLSTERSWQMSNKGGSRLSAASCHLQPASSPHCLPPRPFPSQCLPVARQWATGHSGEPRW